MRLSNRRREYSDIFNLHNPDLVVVTRVCVGLRIIQYLKRLP